jgi:hypothetical protein
VEILQDIPTGAQRSEIVTVNGEPSATPTAPEAPTAPELNTDILLQVVPLASVTVTEGAMVMTDLTIAYEMVTPSELEAVETIATGAQTTASNAQTAAGNAQTTANTASTNATNALNMIRSTSSDAYSSSKAYSVGDHVIYNNKVYKCITACSAGSWSTNRSCFEQTTLTGAVSELNSALDDKADDDKYTIVDFTTPTLTLQASQSNHDYQNRCSIPSGYKAIAILDSFCSIGYITSSSMLTNSNGTIKWSCYNPATTATSFIFSVRVLCEKL